MSTLQVGIQYVIKNEHQGLFGQYYHLMEIFAFLNLKHHHLVAHWLKLWGH